MNKFLASVLATLTAAAIVADVGMLFQFGNRLARIEAQLEMLAAKTTIAHK